MNARVSIWVHSESDATSAIAIRDGEALPKLSQGDRENLVDQMLKVKTRGTELGGLKSNCRAYRRRRDVLLEVKSNTPDRQGRERPILILLHGFADEMDFREMLHTVKDSLIVSDVEPYGGFSFVEDCVMAVERHIRWQENKQLKTLIKVLITMVLLTSAGCLYFVIKELAR